MAEVRPSADFPAADGDGEYEEAIEEEGAGGGHGRTVYVTEREGGCPSVRVRPPGYGIYRSYAWLLRRRSGHFGRSGALTARNIRGRRGNGARAKRFTSVALSH